MVEAFDDSVVVMLDEALAVGDAAVDSDAGAAGPVTAEGVGASAVAAVPGVVAVMLGAGAFGALSARGCGETFGVAADSLLGMRSLSVVVDATLALLDVLREAFVVVVLEARASFDARGLLGSATGSDDCMATLVPALSLPLSARVAAGAAGALVSATVAGGFTTVAVRVDLAAASWLDMERSNM